MTQVVINVLGIPASKGSPRPVMRGGRAFLTPSHSATGQRRLSDWNGAVRSQALLQLGERTEPVFIQKPLAVQLVFHLTRPQGHWSTKGGLKLSAPIAPATKPDIDKLARSTLDSLIGLAFDDDSRIVSLVVLKLYAQPGQEGARITVREFDEAMQRAWMEPTVMVKQGSEGMRW